MDSFGRLPSDVINQITTLYSALEITVIDEGNQKIYFIMKTLHYTCKFRCITPLCNINDVDMCNMYELNEIKQMIDYKTGSYIQQYDNEKFSIVINNNITVSTQDVDMVLPISCLDDFIAGLQKLYNILDAYPKYNSMKRY
jgi:hypothetical protein